MQAIGNDGQWHEWEELSQEERDAWVDAMAEADRQHDYYKTHEKATPLLGIGVFPVAIMQL